MKLFFTDIDGVWTDGGMYYTESGDEFKKFNTSDSAGVILLRHVGIETVIITGENSQIVTRRAAKLGIDSVFLGIRDKLGVATNYLREKNLSLDECAYIGDDYADLPLLQKVKLSACPQNAPEGIKSKVTWVLGRSGGEGVFREFVEKYLENEGHSIEHIFRTVLHQ